MRHAVHEVYRTLQGASGHWTHALSACNDSIYLNPTAFCIEINTHPMVIKLQAGFQQCPELVCTSYASNVSRTLQELSQDRHTQCKASSLVDSAGLLSSVLT